MNKLFKNQMSITNNVESTQITTVMDELEALALDLYDTPEKAEKALKEAIFKVDYQFKVGQAVAVNIAREDKSPYDVSVEKGEMKAIDPVVVNCEGEKKYLRDYKMDIIANLKNKATYKIKKGASL